MARRPGFSLTEVLVALFLMAIGVLGVLTMFPVGALQMAQALKDQRCAEAATQADAFMRWYWRSEIVEKQGNSEPMWLALNGGAATPPVDDNPGPPVAVDPMGIYDPAPRGLNTYLGGTTNIPRRNLNLIAPGGALQALRTCTLLDGLSYDKTGIPRVTGGSIEREDRYNWLWILQRPRNRQKYTVNMTIVCFDKRPHQYTPPNAEVVLSGATFTDNQATVTLSSALPQLQKGGWIMDASTVPTTGSSPVNIQQAALYRVASSATSGTTTVVELNTPVRPALGAGTRASGTALYLDGVAEVFERLPLTADDPNAP